ncbi:hypothetical protein DEJ47_15030 [Streptomyces venezuelae]|uniref:Uncharacterized protein n=1 Tax=Streptomyces venezuelae TaxID=54571 RepID=A0A5P2BBZ0_STRVZ|nr:hypothetical protein DEJ47_15030 [Streptomyces venezuelae]
MAQQAPARLWGRDVWPVARQKAVRPGRYGTFALLILCLCVAGCLEIGNICAILFGARGLRRST